MTSVQIKKKVLLYLPDSNSWFLSHMCELACVLSDSYPLLFYICDDFLISYSLINKAKNIYVDFAYFKAVIIKNSEI